MRRLWGNSNHDLVNTSSAQQFIKRWESPYCRAAVALNKARLTLIKHPDHTRTRALLHELFGEPLADFARADNSEVLGQTPALLEPVYAGCGKQAKPT